MESKNIPVNMQGKENFGPRIVSERERLKIKQIDLCVRAGITKTTQIKYEASEGKPGIDYLNVLDSLGFDILYIITGDRMTGSQLSEQQQNLIDIWEAAPAVLRDAALAVLLSPHHPEILKRERDIPGRFAHGVLGQDTPRFEFFMQIFRRFRASKGKEPLTASRYTTASTQQNLEAILSMLKNPDLSRVFLFATPEDEVAGFNSKNDGPDTNLPLVAALVELAPKGVRPIYVVYDGCFLTAVRPPRYGEVRLVLNEAVASGKAFYCTERVPFTSSLAAEEAAEVMLNCGEFLPLDASGRTRYFSLLSNCTEETLRK